MNGMTPPTSGQDTMQSEAGASDNRLSLNPSSPQFSDAIGSWEDGKKYSLKLQVQQISPGEFEVLSATEGEGADEPQDSAAEDTSEQSSPATKSTYGNPAVAGLMNG